MKRFFGLDLRSLALMRMSLALVILWDLFSRWFYSSEFVWGQSLALSHGSLEHLQLDFVPSIHILSSGLAYQAGLALVHLVLALALLLGWRTRWVTPVLWFFTLSLHFSSEFLLNGGDYLLRIFLFIGSFLPWGRALSLDARHEEPGQLRVANAATILLFAQICLLYWSAAMLKTEPAWTKEHTAIYYALSLDTFATPWGLKLSQYPLLMKGLTALTYWTEWLAPLLLLLGQPALRLVGIGLLFALHLGISLTLAVGLFWAVPLAGLLAFVPSEVWERLGPATESSSRTSESLPTALQGGLGLLILLLVYLNLSTNRALKLPEPLGVYKLARTLGLHYGWGMFVRVTSVQDGWLQAVITTEDGSQHDALWGTDVGPDRPTHLASRYPNQRWRRYLLNLREERFQVHRAPFLRHLEARWMEEKGRADVRSATLTFWSEPTLPNYQDVEPMKVELSAEDPEFERSKKRRE